MLVQNTSNWCLRRVFKVQYLNENRCLVKKNICTNMIERILSLLEQTWSGWGSNRSHLVDKLQCGYHHGIDQLSRHMCGTVHSRKDSWTHFVSLNRRQNSAAERILRTLSTGNIWDQRMTSKHVDTVFITDMSSLSTLLTKLSFVNYVCDGNLSK